MRIYKDLLESTHTKGGLLGKLSNNDSAGRKLRSELSELLFLIVSRIHEAVVQPHYSSNSCTVKRSGALATRLTLCSLGLEEL